MSEKKLQITDKLQ